jgi:hypothetical protein
LGAVEEDPHAQGFGALHSHQPHLSANVIYVVDPIHLCLVVRRIPVQARDSLFDGLTEPRADLKAFLSGAIQSHGGFLGAGLFEAADFSHCNLKFSSLVPMLVKDACSRQITTPRIFGNTVSEKNSD